MTSLQPEPVLVASDLRKTYEHRNVRVEALRGVSLSVGRGEMVAVTGPSGSGKSTLLAILGGLDAPTSGTVRVGEHDVTCKDDAARTIFRRRHVGFVFQFFNLLPTLTAHENVALPLLLDGRTPAQAAPRAEALLARVGLAARAAHRPDELSGGEMQRVAIARALAPDPLLLLADEPTGNLDSASGESVLAILDEARRERGLTVLLVTHDPDIARRADRRVVLRDGLLVDGAGEPDCTRAATATTASSAPAPRP